MAKIGDTVRFLNSVGGGKIIRIEGNVTHVEDNDGFEVPVLLRECVVVMAAGDARAKASVDTQPAPAAPSKEVKAPAAPPVAPAPPVETPLPVEETPEGNVLNIIMAIEPGNVKELSHTEFEATLVNDSNYFISFALSARSESDSSWTLVKASTAEPNIMLTLGNFEGAELGKMDRLLFQYVAYKADRQFDMKAPASVELKVDTTKYFKLHCYKDCVYFDTPVIAYNLVTDDHPYRAMKVDGAQLEREMNSKKVADRRPVVKRRPARRNNDIIEVDLHINELVDSTSGLSRADMLNLQIDEFRRVMDANLKNKGQKIVFIHGKGEGILRQAILKELNHRYKGHDVCDASFREYGFGATQVTI